MSTAVDPMAEQPPSLFTRLGGQAALESAVVLFYDKVMADPELAPFFERLEMGIQVRKQIRFMTYAFGGPQLYSGPDLRTAHKHLVHQQGLSDKHFDAIARNLQATLQELNVPADVIDECIALVGSLRSEVLDR
jgi:hemoglobin